MTDREFIERYPEYCFRIGGKLVVMEFWKHLIEEGRLAEVRAIFEENSKEDSASSPDRGSFC